MKQITLFLILLLPVFLSATTQSTTTRGINIDGNVTTASSNGDNDGDWEPNEAMSGNMTTWYMSWDDNNLYIGRTGGNNAEPQLIYIQAEYPGSVYSASAFNYDNFTPNFSGMTGVNFIAYLKSGYDEFRTYNGSWSSQNTSLNPAYGTNMEISIPWTNITNGNGKPSFFRPVFYQTNGNAGGIFAYGESPNGNPDGGISSPVISNWWGGYAVTSGIAPNGTMDGALPVELISFKATAHANTVILNWATASEINNSHFEVERSNDSYNWSIIGSVTGRGTTAAQNQYKLTDENPKPGNNYYRLKQVDFDGRFEYTDIVLAQVDAGQTSLYPNPVKNHLFITTDNATIGDRIEVYSMQGTLLHATYISNNEFTKLDCHTFENGIYLLNILNENGMVKSNHRFVKQ